MSDLRDLYQTVILDHYKKPRNFGRPPDADLSAEGVNPLCGDRVQVFVRLEGDQLAAVGFEGSGCAISTAAASLMTEAVQGRTRKQIDELFARYHDMVTGARDADSHESAGQTLRVLPHESAGQTLHVLPSLGKLEVLAGVREFPARVKCATLVWHALLAALEGRGERVTTE